jgi:hypothetical protein
MAFFAWEAALDPYDVKDYKVDYAAEMTATDDTILTSAFVPSAEAAMDGLEVVSESHTTTAGTAFLRINPTHRASAEWEGGGKILTVMHTVTTSDARTLRRTIELTVQVR